MATNTKPVPNVLKLSSAVTELSRIGPAKAAYLTKIGITHVRDLIYSFPRRYDDFSKITPISDLKEGEQLTVKGNVKKVTTNYGFRGRRRLLRIYVEIEDESGVLSVTWYNLTFLPKQLWEGRELAIAGKVELTGKGLPSHLLKKNSKKNSNEKNKIAIHRMRSPIIEFSDNSNESTHTGRITPVYSETYGVTSRFLRYHIKNSLPLINSIPEYLPQEIIQRNKLIGIHEAIKSIHFPLDDKNLAKAQKRLRFDELFFLQLAIQVRRRDRETKEAYPISIKKTALNNFMQNLPFELTSAQKVVVDEIIADLKTKSPMNRLLQGDVGSGKSVVSLIATKATLISNYQVMYLAPTEILARQQANDFKKSLPGHEVELLIGSSSNKERQKIDKQLQAGEPICLVGTHALLQDNISSRKLALAIVDEQHRFGVKQRKALQESGNIIPHLLSMTATPIPRTLTLTIYGDLDVSVLDELPSGRKSIDTSIVAPGDRDEILTDVLAQIHIGRQAFVIAPLVEESEKLAAKSAKETLQEMKEYFPGVAIELVHGKMHSADKKVVMENFSAGAIQVLVSTAVVEVGVNIPNATCMIIEGAERFGLSQLHQFRGRVGRGKHKSYCYLFPTSEEGLNNDRLKALVGTSDGFAIAEKDLALRGPGEVYGTKQSGYGDLKVASLLDYASIKLAREEAELILRKNPSLKKYPILLKKVEQKNLSAHFE